jgi:holo-[acyl-carrier protein] synthase
VIVGIGTDIVEIQRIREIVEKRGQSFLSRIFTDAEKEYCLSTKDPAARCAGRYAAKEAVLKALGTGLRGLRWRDIEIIRNSAGKPIVRLTAGAAQLAESLGITEILLTISHSRDYAVALAVACQEGEMPHAHCPAE